MVLMMEDDMIDFPVPALPLNQKNRGPDLLALSHSTKALSYRIQALVPSVYWSRKKMKSMSGSFVIPRHDLISRESRLCNESGFLGRCEATILLTRDFRTFLTVI